MTNNNEKLSANFRLHSQRPVLEVFYGTPIIKLREPCDTTLKAQHSQNLDSETNTKILYSGLLADGIG